MYNDIVEYLWDKYHLNEISETNYMTEDRKDEVFNKLLDYVYEHTVDEKDHYNALTNIIGLTDDEISYLGIDVEMEEVENEM